MIKSNRGKIRQLNCLNILKVNSENFQHKIYEIMKIYFKVHYLEAC